MSNFEEMLLKVMNERMDRIEKKLDDINAWKWKLVGGFSVVSLLISIGVKFI